MAKTQILDYYIHVSDQALAELLQAQLTAGHGVDVGALIYNPNTGVYGISRAPYNPVGPGGAAVEFAIKQGTYPPAFTVLEVGDVATPDALSSPWFTNSNSFPRDVATFTISSGWWIFGSSTKFYWSGHVVYTPAAETTGIPDPADPSSGVEVERAPIPLRYAICGFEMNQGGEGQFPVSTPGVGRHASRTIDGLGQLVGSNDAVGDRQELTSVSTVGFAIATIKQHAERFYIRVDRLPNDVTERLWRTVEHGNTGLGFVIGVSPGGEWILFKYSATSTFEVVGSIGTVTLGAWTKFDTIQKFDAVHTRIATGGASDLNKATIRVWINGVAAGSADSLPTAYTSGLNDGWNHSELGKVSAVDYTGEYAMDDWRMTAVPKDKDLSPSLAYDPAATYAINAFVTSGGFAYRAIAAVGVGEAPPNAAKWVKLTDSLDWVHGCHMQLVKPKVTGASMGSWAGDARSLIPTQELFTAGLVTSSTSGAVVDVDTDFVEACNRYGGVLGWLSFVVGLASSRGSTQGSLGHNVNGAGFASTALTTQTANPTLGWTYVLKSGGTGAAGQLTPQPITSLVLRHTKGADVSAAQIKSLGAVVELIGTFGEEDRVAGDETPIEERPAGAHMSHYAMSPWARAQQSALGPVIIKSGTYVGNGTGQDLLFKAPVSFIWIRPVGTTNVGVRWWGSMLGVHDGGGQIRVEPVRLHVDQDLSFVPASDTADQQLQFRVRIAGNDVNINANAATFAYVAFMDPAARFLRCEAITGGTQNLPKAIALTDPDFTPEMILAISEALANSTTNALGLKGPAHASDAYSILETGTPTTNALSMAAGAVTLRSTFILLNTLSQIALACWRRSDGNDDAGEAAVMSIGSYVGDGAASKSVAVAPAPGKRPLWAYIQPHNAAGFYRDPSHTGTTSQAAGGAANASTGLTAGSIDGFAVGSSGNANGITYTYFVLWGSATAGNGGWSIDGEFTPVAADSLPGDDPVEIPADEDDGDGGGGGGEGEIPDLDEEPDFDDDTPLPGTDEFCVTFTQQACNMALSRIGVSKFITAIATDLGTEARVARLHAKTAVEYVLSRFPWPFATSVRTLVLVDGSPSDPVNRDWTYSYRKPTDCVFERRIVSTRNGAVDPTPPAMQLGRDSSGGLIFTNEASAKLEYTARGLCPAYEGDDLFKEAVIWKLAADFAPSLTKIPEKVTHALEMVETTIAKAYDVLRPANPGPVEEADADALDQAATAAAANLTVINRALIRIGARTIGAITQDSREARSVRTVFEAELKTVLRDHTWAFATRYAELALVAGPAGVDEPLVQTYDAARTYEENETVSSGAIVYYALRQTIGDTPVSSANDWTTDEPTEANADWVRGFRLPTDCVFARRLVRPGARRQYDETPYTFKLGSDEGGIVLFTDAEEVTLEYTARFDGIVARGDALFLDMLAWRLAAALAPSLAQVDPEEVEQLGRGPDATAIAGKGTGSKANKAAVRQRVAEWAMAKYLFALEGAKVGNKNEQQEVPDGDAPWISER